VHAFALGSEDTEYLGGLVAGAAEPVRGLEAAWVAGKRDDGAPVALSWFQPDAGVCDVGGAGPHGLGIRDEGGEYQADLPTARVIAGHLWCDVRHLQVSGIDVVQDYGTVPCSALLPAQLL
jgi:hypothetical protein